MQSLDDAMPADARLRLIETLRDITEGKIYLELERATLTRRLVAIQEAEGRLEQAAKTLQEVQVETIGSMPKRDKVEYVLEQMRLTLATGDYVRTKILSNKINRDNVNDKELQDLKLRFQDLMIQYHKHEDGPAELWRDFEAIFNTPRVQADEAQWRDALAHHVLFLALTEYHIEPYTALEGLRKTHAKKLAAMPAFECVSAPLYAPVCWRVRRRVRRSPPPPPSSAQVPRQVPHHPGDHAVAAALRRRAQEPPHLHRHRQVGRRSRRLVGHAAPPRAGARASPPRARVSPAPLTLLAVPCTRRTSASSRATTAAPACRTSPPSSQWSSPSWSGRWPTW